MTQRKITLALDIDLTVVDSLTPWLEWFKRHTGLNFDPHLYCQESYNMAPAMNKLVFDIETEHGLKLGLNDAYDFWRQTRLYNNMRLIVNCVDIVERLQAEYDINLVFVSTCDPDHEVSKRGLIAKNFKDYGFISTHDKGFVAYDILVDDNIDVLRKAHAVRPQAAYVAHRQINKFGGAVPEFAWVSHAWDNNMYQLLKTLIEKRLARLEVDLV